MKADIVIVGGGVIGSSIAFHLRSLDPRVSVCVVERDPTYRTASSALSASSIRQQFSTPVNIAMSRYGMEFLRSLDEHLSVEGSVPSIGLVERGYLYLATAQGREILRQNHELQLTCGVDVAFLEREDLARALPWMYTEDLAAGSLGLSAEGWFDGYSLLQAFRQKARALGAEYLTADVSGFRLGASAVNAVQLRDGQEISCARVVNAAGPQARSVARMAGIELPVYPDPHTIFVFECETPPADCPLIIDPTGLYVRPEGKYFLVGAPHAAGIPSEQQTLEVDNDAFESEVWPILAARVPAFESIRLRSAWAGFYEMNAFDHNAILGATPQVPNFVLANGFSGHGMQHSPAAGRGIAEYLLYGEFRSIDLNPLGYERLIRNEPLRELNII
jgi:glycine/D-amino acid oxidase-like deaminating enzyme